MDNARRNLLEQFQPFRAHRVLVWNESGDVTARMGKTRDETVGNRIGDLSEYDRDCAGRLSQCHQSWRGGGKEHVWCQAHQLGRVDPPKVGVIGPAIIDLHVAAVYPAQLLEPLPKPPNTGLPFRIAFSESYQHSDPAYPIRLLRTCCKRTRRRATKERDEIASPQMIGPHVPPLVRGPHRILPKIAYRGQGAVTYFAVHRETHGTAVYGTKWRSFGLSFMPGIRGAADLSSVAFRASKSVCDHPAPAAKLRLRSARGVCGGHAAWDGECG
jgi:hypothetical protein